MNLRNKYIDKVVIEFLHLNSWTFRELSEKNSLIIQVIFQYASMIPVDTGQFQENLPVMLEQDLEGKRFINLQNPLAYQRGSYR